MAGRGPSRERGYAALWVIGSIVVSGAVGFGVYLAIKEARAAGAADEVSERSTPLPDERAAPPTPAPRPRDPLAEPPDATEVAAPPADDPAAGTAPAPGETLGTPGVAGGLDAAAVHATLKETLPKLKACETISGGTVTVTLEVNRRGGVSSTKVEASDEPLGACTAKVLSQVRFARTTDGKTATVLVPLAFERAPAACDEVSCVLDNYAGACCEKYKRGGAGTAAAPMQPGRDEIVTALRPDRRAVSTCAVAANFEGTLKVRFTIAPEGTVSKVSIEDAEPELTACVARVIKKHTFSKSQQGVTVSFPFTVPL